MTQICNKLMNVKKIAYLSSLRKATDTFWSELLEHFKNPSLFGSVTILSVYTLIQLPPVSKQIVQVF